MCMCECIQCGLNAHRNCLFGVCGDCVSTNMDTCNVSVVKQDIFMLFRVNMLSD